MASRMRAGAPTEAVETLFDRYEFLLPLLEEPMDKRTLVAETDVSRSTVSRALRDLESVHLVERTNGEHEPTAFGRLLGEEFSSLLDTAAFAWETRDILDQLPVDALDFPLSRLADARVTTPSTENPTAPMDRVLEIKEATTHLRSLASGRTPGVLDAHEQGLDGDSTFESVCSRDLLSWLVADEERRGKLAGLLESENAAVYAYDGDIPLPLGVADGTAFFGVASEEGAPIALVESTDDRVVEWAVDMYESRARHAQEVAAGELDEFVSE